jgi:hypothetical protein
VAVIRSRYERWPVIAARRIDISAVMDDFFNPCQVIGSDRAVYIHARGQKSDARQGDNQKSAAKQDMCLVHLASMD